MCSIVRSYFTWILAGELHEDVAAYFVCHRTVTNEQNGNLVEDVTFEEFTIAVKQMHPDKGSGPDGLNLAFFKTFWPILGHEVFNCCKDWLCTNSVVHKFGSSRAEQHKCSPNSQKRKCLFDEGSMTNFLVQCFV